MMPHPRSQDVRRSGGRKGALYGLVFGSGAILMSLELLGSRLLAPTYGSSIVVWASLIGVFLASLAVGYWIGGVVADAHPRPTGLAIVLGSAGLVVWLVPILTEGVFALAGPDLHTGSLLATFGLFFVPVVLLAMISPYAIRLHGSEQERLGSTTGRLYALSSAGSIAGTLGTAFYLLPLAAVEDLVRGLGTSLLALASVTLFAAGRRPGGWAVGLLAMAFGIAIVAPPSFSTVIYDGQPLRIIHRAESSYQHIQVLESSTARYLRFGNRWQGGMVLDQPTRGVFAYTDYLHLGFLSRPAAKDVLLIGLGAGLTAKQFLQDYPAARIDVVEIDPTVVEIARQHFALPDDPRLQVHVQDGRRFLATTDRRYDLIVLDAYSSEGIPFHLATREFFDLTRDRLQPQGLVVSNVIGALSGPGSGLLPTYYRTGATVFAEHALFGVGWASDSDPRRRRNFILLLGPGLNDALQRLPAVTQAAVDLGVRAEYAALATDLVRQEPDLSDATVLTDRYAPAEQYVP